MFSRRAILKSCAASCALSIALAAPAPEARAGVTLKADLGQSVIHTGADGRIYLRLSLKGIKAPRTERRTPVNIALVLDRSGSMRGRRLIGAKAAAIMALNRLADDDIISLVTYNHGVQVVKPAGRLTDYAALKADIDALQAGGRTALYAGVAEGARQIREFIAPHNVNRVILLSDGLANVGPSKPDQLAELGRQLGAEGISVTTIGLGLQYNEDLMAKLALASDGNHAFVESPDDLVKIFNAEFGDVLSVVAQDIIINIDCGRGFRPKRILGRSAEIDGSRIKFRLNQLYGAQEKYIIVELEALNGAQAGAASGTAGDIAEISVDYLDLQSKRRQQDRAGIRARFTNEPREARASINKGVMTQVTTQIATETNERAVSLRDKGDIKGARKLLQDNAAFLNRKAAEYAAPALATLEQKNRTQARGLDARSWAKTRKAMRYNQHQSKVQQSY